MTETTAASRSRAALPSDYRRVLEASNLPIEQAVAIADMVELALSDTAARDAALEEAAAVCENAADAPFGTHANHVVRKVAAALRALKNAAPQENKTETASQGAGFLAPADGSLSNSSAPAESASPCVAVPRKELQEMLSRAEMASEVTLPVDKFRDLVLQAMEAI